MLEQPGIHIRDLLAHEYKIARDFAKQQGQEIPETHMMRTIALAEESGEPCGVQVYDWTGQGVHEVKRIIAAKELEKREEIAGLFADRIEVVRRCCGFEDE